MEVLNHESYYQVVLFCLNFSNSNDNELVSLFEMHRLHLLCVFSFDIFISMVRDKERLRGTYAGRVKIVILLKGMANSYL